MSAQKPASWVYTEEFISDLPVMDAARRRGHELGATPVSPGVGATLRVLAAAAKTRTAVEIGSGAGVSGLYLLQGMPADGVLTTIERNMECHKAARTTFRAAGIPTQHTRAINGDALDMLPRLADRGYDLVFIDGDETEYADYVSQAVRLLRPGGLLVIDDMLWHDRVSDPAARDETTVNLRDLGKELRDDDNLEVALLPVGGGLLVGTRR
ncbi:O-methyltransferase [Dermatophilus congolensis]|nr:O-methyltransferase [Dermatophilus congolensis]MBO3129693.1 O-methyltransferase [Dermatophilus congolensis]MBO3131677.1 O-methyltransferase [Dermatophilus congolensis]MBO3134168.1 O-methyltransferase [Dermatophilus congolensis]MBO3136401.1 O-methyltransferase [Dermatophilus congolensis]MBO3138650.1 O-methyltransferase [Dermatophilus congolensis]